MEIEAKRLIKGGEFIIKDSLPEDIFTPRGFFGGANYDERKRSRIY